MDVADEAHVEHPVGFIEHQDFDAIQADRPLLHQVHQATRGRHQHIGAGLQAGDLGVDLDPAEDDVGAQVQMAGVGLDVVGHLGRQLPSRGQHQRAHNPAAGMGAVAEPLQHRQGEASGLARPGLGGRHHVTPRQHRWNALLLNRGRLAVALLQHRLDDRSPQTKGGEGRLRELLLIHRGQRHGGLGRRLGSGRQPLHRSGPAPTPGGTIGGGDKQASRSFTLRLRTRCTAAGPDPG